MIPSQDLHPLPYSPGDIAQHLGTFLVVPNGGGGGGGSATVYWVEA